MRAPRQVKVLKLEGFRGWGLRNGERATPGRIGLLQARLLKICGSLPRTGPAFGLDHGEKGYEACWRAPMELPAPAELHEAAAPGGWYAAAAHHGGYDAMGDALEDVLARWLPHSGFRRAEGPVVYLYLTDPREAAEADLRTEIRVPVVPDPIE